jgi:hypothetical protein
VVLFGSSAVTPPKNDNQPTVNPTVEPMNVTQVGLVSGFAPDDGRASARSSVARAAAMSVPQLKQNFAVSGFCLPQ